MKKLHRLMILVVLALALSFLTPGQYSEADCVAGYFNGTGNAGCLMCMNVGGFGMCRDVIGNGHCACSSFGNSCVSSGGNCTYYFFWWPL